MDAGSIEWVAVLVAAVSSFLIGGLWYGPLFGKVWMRASGVDEAKVNEANMPMIFGASFVLQLVAAFVLAMFVGPEAGVGFATAAGAAVGACWVATALGTTYLFEQRPLAHWAVNAGYSVVTFTVMGLVIGLF